MMGNEESAQSGQTGELSATARDILEKAGVRQDAASDSSKRGDGEDQEVQLEIGGAKRSVKLRELTQAYLEREKTAGLKQLVDQKVAEIGDTQALRQIKQMIEELPAERRQRVFDLLSGRDEQDDGDDDSDFDLDAKPAPKKPTRELPDDVRSEIGQLKQVVAALANDYAQTLHSRRTAGLKEQVEEKMRSFEVFRGDSPVAQLSLESIVRQVAANEATVEQAVAQAASKVQRLLDQHKQKLVEEITSPPQLPTIKGGVTGRSMLNGDLRRAAHQHIQNVLRQQG